MSSPFVCCSLPRSAVVGIHIEALEWDEDGMVPLREEEQGIGIVMIDGAEIAFFAYQSPVAGEGNVFRCQRQCEDAFEIADRLEGMGIPARVIE